MKVNARMKSWMRGESEDSVSLMMEMENQCLVFLHADLVTNYQEQYMELIGTEGILVVSGREGKIIPQFQSSAGDRRPHGIG